jgi:hypothetical protein
MGVSTSTNQNYRLFLQHSLRNFLDAESISIAHRVKAEDNDMAKLAEVQLSAGWLKNDVKRAQSRLAEWMRSEKPGATPSHGNRHDTLQATDRINQGSTQADED